MAGDSGGSGDSDELTLLPLGDALLAPLPLPLDPPPLPALLLRDALLLLPLFDRRLCLPSLPGVAVSAPGGILALRGLLSSILLSMSLFPEFDGGDEIRGGSEPYRAAGLPGPIVGGIPNKHTIASSSKCQSPVESFSNSKYDQ